MMFDVKLGRVSPMIDRLWLGAMRAVGMMRPFSHSFASEPVASAYADERPVHDALRFSCNGLLRVLPWSSPLLASRQYDKKIAC
jgi:hypothetical protein